MTKKLTKESLTRGVYCLVLSLDRDKIIRAGRHSYNFEEGFYCFVGSEPKDLYNKIKNHIEVASASKGEKILMKMNIDYLLKHANLIYYNHINTSPSMESRVNNKVKELSDKVFKGFSGSLSKDEGNLHYFRINPLYTERFHDIFEGGRF